MKKISVTSWSAITILNAVKSQFGAAVATAIPISVSISPSNKLILSIHPKGVGDELIRSCLDVLTKYLPKKLEIAISIFSPLAPQRGLKTSSAVSTALIFAFSRYYNFHLSIEQIITLSAKASINCGVSITGAIDDAYASFCGGLAITDTKKRKLLLHDDWTYDTVYLIIPDKKNDKQKIPKILQNFDLGPLKLANKALKEKKYRSVIKYNAQAYAPYLTNNYKLLEKIQSYKEISNAGLNGTGPSLFAIGTPGQVKLLRKNFKTCTVIETSLLPRMRLLNKSGD